MTGVVHNHGRSTSRTLRQKPLDVMGVGTGSQSCSHDHTFPLALRETSSGDGQSDSHEGVFETPIVPGSSLPAILGLETMTNQRGLLDLVHDRLYLCGSDEFDPMQGALPNGTMCFDLQRTYSGNLMNLLNYNCFPR